MSRSLNWSRDRTLWPGTRFSHFTEAAGIRWHIQRAGQGPALLLLHGSGSSVHTWSGLLPLLAARHQVLAVDLPGHGFSSRPGDLRFTMGSLVERIGRLLEAESFHPERIVGHSAGAALGVILHLEALPDLVELVGLAPALGRPRRGAPPKTLQAMAAPLTRSGIVATLSSELMDRTPLVRGLLASTGSRVPTPSLRCYERLFADPGHVAGTLALFSDWDPETVSARRREVRCPVHLVVGENDRWITPDEIRDNAQGLSASEITVLPRLGHLLHEEDPEAVASAAFDVVSDV